MSKYSERISRSKDQVSTDSVKLAETQARLSVEAAIIAAKGQIATINAAKEAALGANPFSIARVIQLGKEQAEVEATQTVAENLLSTEFSN